MGFDRRQARIARKARIRKRISGTAQRPRLCIYRSSRHIYAQLVDDINGKTLLSVSTLSKGLKEEAGPLKKREAAKKVGAALAVQSKAKGIESVIFDRNGYRFHGRVSALASGAREGGLKF